MIAAAPVGRIYWAQTFATIIVMPWGMDMSFLCATILLTNNTPAHSQGLASSIVITAVNYSVSLGLGIAGTALRNVNSDGMDVLAGYRSACYFGVGLDVLAVVVALYFVWKY